MVSLSRLLFSMAVIPFLAFQASACIAPDAGFKVLIADLEVDFQRLNEVCLEESCILEEDYASILSPSDPKIIITFGETELIEDTVVSFILPYDYESGQASPVEGYEPQGYDWLGLVDTDIGFLKRIKVIQNSEEELDEVVSLVNEGGTLITKCNGTRTEAAQNCFCGEEGLECVRCGPSEEEYSLPERPKRQLELDAAQLSLPEPVYDEEGNVVVSSDELKKSTSTLIETTIEETSLSTITIPQLPTIQQESSEDKLNELLPYIIIGAAVLIVLWLTVFKGE
ncbi:hypothetical protein ACFLRC_03010 [Candidatus Altiarchaeota archaeon]